MEEAIRTTAFVAVGLLLPQALAYAAYRWSRSQAVGFKVLCYLVAPSVYWVSANLYWDHEAAVVQSHGHRVCGAMGMAMAITTSFGTFFHFAAGVIFLLLLSWLWKRKALRPNNRCLEGEQKDCGEPQQGGTNKSRHRQECLCHTCMELRYGLVVP